MKVIGAILLGLLIVAAAIGFALAIILPEIINHEEDF